MSRPGTKVPVLIVILAWGAGFVLRPVLDLLKAAPAPVQCVLGVALVGAAFGVILCGVERSDRGDVT